MLDIASNCRYVVSNVLYPLPPSLPWHGIHVVFSEPISNIEIVRIDLFLFIGTVSFRVFIYYRIETDSDIDIRYPTPTGLGSQGQGLGFDVRVWASFTYLFFIKKYSRNA